MRRNRFFYGALGNLDNAQQAFALETGLNVKAKSHHMASHEHSG